MTGVGSRPGVALRAAELERVARAVAAISADGGRAAGVDLDRLARDAGWSRSRFDRVFRTAVGLSPERFVSAATLDFARRRLAECTVRDAAADAGLSGPSRLHDLCVSFEGLTPGEWRRRGQAVRIWFGFAPTAFGRALLARTERGICALFLGDEAECRADLAKRFPGADLVEDSPRIGPELRAIFDTEPRRDRPFHLDLRGTSLQLAVWEALLAVRAGELATYSDIARLAGRPDATRAVATAIGRNPVSYLIPCHRVLRKSGELGGYRWGVGRKRALLAVESELAAGA